MKTEKDIKYMLTIAYDALKETEKLPPGHCYWRIAKTRVEVLEWVLELE